MENERPQVRIEALFLEGDEWVPRYFLSEADFEEHCERAMPLAVENVQRFMEAPMKVTAKYLESVKDATGTIRTYSCEMTKEFSEDGLEPEQVMEKANAIHGFLHDEIHRSIQEQQVADGVLSAVTHQ
jgi:hypothetical protein